MADFNARIKPKKSSTAGEVPQAADLEVSELAVNTADGKLFTKHTDNSIKEIGGGTDITTESIDALSDVDTSTTPPTAGQVLTWVNVNNQWEPATPATGGATSIDDLTDVDTTTDPPSLNQILIWDGSNWVPQDIASEGGITEQTGDLTAFPLHGIDGFYADQAALEADGFTFITGSANADDFALTFDPGAQWNGVQFLQYTPNSANWFVNSNGGVGFDQGGGTTTGRSGDALSNAATLDLYVSLWSQDTETRLAGYKAIQEGGFDWLVVRMDLKVPYSSETDGFPVEVWFSSGGAVSVRYGTSVNGATFTVGATRSVIVSNGSVVPGTSAPYTGLTGSGAYGISFDISPGTGLQLDSLGDVNAPSPTNGQVLTWNNAAQFWTPQTPTLVTSIDDLTDVDTSTAAPTDGQVLTWVNANNRWEPAQLPMAAETRTLLGIGEYADDAAAGTGGVASGAMYYNTTSSDYRLKT